MHVFAFWNLEQTNGKESRRAFWLDDRANEEDGSGFHI